MGWSYFSDPKFGREQLAAYLLSRECLGDKHRVLRHSLVGNHLWSVVERVKEDGTTHRYIGLDLLASGRPEMGWGYKDLCESMGPCEVDCPVGFFELVPLPPNDSAEAWRAAVIAYHQKKRRERAESHSLDVGDTLTLPDGDYRLDERLGRKGWRVTRLTDGQVFRLPAKQAKLAVRKRMADNRSQTKPKQDAPHQVALSLADPGREVAA